MKPPPFDYERPANTDAALASLAHHGGRAKVLAGGQSLLAMLNLRLVSPERLIDVSRLNELKYIRVAGNELRIGADDAQHGADVGGRYDALSDHGRSVPAGVASRGAQPGNHRRQPVP
jgi:CO/xanthine dehydrogenase FAD-binding subunit